MLVGFIIYFGFAVLGESVLARYSSLKDFEMVSQRTVITTTRMFSMLFLEFPFGKGLGIGSTASRHLLGDLGGWFLIENYLSKLQLEFGIVGVVSFVSLIVSLIVLISGKWLKRSGPNQYEFVAAMSAYVVVLFGVATFFGNMETTPVSIFLWTMVGFLARLDLLNRIKTAPSLVRPQTAGIAK